MTKTNLIAFGAGRFSQSIVAILEHDTQYQVVAHTVDNGFIDPHNSTGKPVVRFDDLPLIYPPSLHQIVLPMSWVGVNQIRAQKCQQALDMGYTLASYTSSNSVILTKEVMGDHVLLFEGAIIQPFVKIGDNVIIRSGSILGHHTIIESNCFIASRVVTGGNVVVEENATIGLGAVISDGVRIGARSFIGAGAVVTSDTEPDGVYVGVPARRLPNKTSLEVTRQAGYDFGIK